MKTINNIFVVGNLNEDSSLYCCTDEGKDFFISDYIYNNPPTWEATIIWVTKAFPDVVEISAVQSLTYTVNLIGGMRYRHKVGINLIRSKQNEKYNY